MPCVLIRFVDRIIGVRGDRFWIMRQRSPDIGYKAIKVVDRFGGGSMWTIKKDGPRSKERLHVILDPPESIPH